MKYLPFYFAVSKSDENTSDVYYLPRRHFVKIASWDVTCYDSYMDSEDLGTHFWVPDPDDTIETYEFKTEEEAFEFIKRWWINGK